MNQKIFAHETSIKTVASNKRTCSLPVSCDNLETIIYT